MRFRSQAMFGSVRRNLRFLLPFLLVAGLWCSAATASPPSATPPLRVVMDNNYPPYVFLDSQGALQGILIDQWRLWEKKTGRAVSISGVDWSTALSLMEAGKFDVIDTLFFNEKRAKIYEFSKSYARLEVPIFFHHDISGISGVDSLKGFVVAVKAGDAAVDFLRKKGVDNLEEFNSYEAIFRAARERKVVTFVVDAPPALYFLYKLGLQKQFRRTAPLYVGEFHRAVLKGNGAILGQVEAGFSAISRDEYLKIERRWLGTPVDYGLYLRYAGIAAAAAALLIVLLAVWNVLLRRTVQQKTARLREEVSLSKRRAEALKESEEKYRNLVENIYDVIFEVDGQGVLTYISPVIRDLSGYDPEEAIGKSFLEFVSPEDRDFVRERFFGLPEKGTNMPLDCRIRDKAGKIHWVRTITRPVVAEGRLVGARGTFIDITEQKQAREQLERSEAKFRKAFNTSPDAVDINCLENGLHVSINDGFSRLTGYSEEEVIGKTAEEFNIWVDQADRQRLLDGLMRDGEVKNLEAAFRMKDGTIRYGLMSASLIDLNGIAHIVTMTRDITERKREEEERLRLHEKLNRTEKIEALGTLAGGVAHDLNNVLGVLIGYSELILHHLPPESPLKPYANKIMDGGQRATAIIQDLLTLARRGVVVSEVVNLNHTVSQFMETPEFAMMRSHHPQVVFQSVSDPRLLNIKGSPVHLTKTLMNLVSNAAEAISGAGEVTIRTQNRYIDASLPDSDETREGEYVVLSVSDTGQGIPAADIKRIFEPFYTKKVMGRSGTGLGLAVVWGTVKDHQGHIDVRSEDGQGSTFTLYFPASREPVTKERKTASRELFKGRGEQILVVDDVEGQRDLASVLLTSLGYKVHVVSSGEDAVAHVTDNPVDLLVLDMIMDPGIDGLETYRRILKIHPGQKAVIVSGFAEDERVKTAQQLGAGAYIRKPYLQEVIGLAIRRELDRLPRQKAP